MSNVSSSGGFTSAALAPQTSPTSLPPQATSLIGREQERAAVRALLRQQETRLITLTGPGGTGKTRLALQIAEDVQHEYRDGVLFVPLASQREPQQVVLAIAQALEVREDVAQSLLAQLCSQLRSKHMLIVLDNFEQVLDAASVVGDMLAAAPGLTIIVTSRAVLRLYAEQEFQVPPLAFPDMRSLGRSPLGMKELLSYPAVQLFVARARAARPSFELDQTNADAIVELCACLDGLPLAIELAAARSKLLSPQAMRSRLGQRLTWLTSGPRDLPTRQQTLRSTISWSYELLDVHEQELFVQLSVFVGGATLDAIEAVCIDRQSMLLLDANSPSMLDQVASLVDKSLVRQEDGADGEPRFVLLETIREYALERWRANGASQDLQRRHAVFYLSLAEQAEPHIDGPGHQKWCRRLEQEHDNFRAALAWSLADTSDATEPLLFHRMVGLRMASALGLFWITRWHATEGRRWLEQLLVRSNTDELEGIQGIDWQKARAKALLVAGGMARYQGDVGAAHVRLEQSLLLAREHNDGALVAEVLDHLLWMVFDQGDYKLAAQLSQEAVDLLRQADPRRRLPRALIAQGVVARAQGDEKLAAQLFEESLSVARERQDTWSLALGLANMGWVAREAGDYERSNAYNQESLAISQAYGDARTMASALSGLSLTFRAQGNYDRAIELAEEALGLARGVDDRRGIVDALQILCNTAKDLGDFARARVLAEESLVLAQQEGNKWSIGWALVNLGWIAYGAHEYGQAKDYFERALAIQLELDDKNNIGMLQTILGRVACRQGDYERAAALLKQSVAAYYALGNRGAAVWALESFASLAAVSGKPERAATLWGVAEAVRQVLPAPMPAYDLREYEQDVAVARSHLDEKRFAAAWAAGKNLTLAQAIRYVHEEQTVSELSSPIRTHSTAGSGVSVELTTRELEVLRLLATGLTNAQIAEQLVLSPLTINAYLRSIYSKLGVGSRTAATRYAIDNHIL